MALPHHPFGTELNQTTVTEMLAQHTSWEDKYRQLILWGKRLPTFTDAQKQTANQVHGCESAVWFLHQAEGDTHYFAADSNARIVKGLLAIVLACVHGQHGNAIHTLDIDRVFQQAGLAHHLSESRTNGLHAIIEYIHQITR
ncbi:MULTISPECIES: cysteine desulfurase sulfur acceptor subunit CsdE [Salinivibrio]|jgi:SufE protein probably involved in Fe-S center assembly|uniref:Cysteine desulfurase, sulfur acceptor subunit CsdE n=1 Tax=Salinivibrio kushneri TaxID=1908198 RepID=A0AB36JW67_9GAMM|nr:MULTISPECIES: cysteine desulfurase sulfur acceptor subunit CsdE [Salinivibrio]ODP95811.1 cysteine desulfurase, sulfur acceptor subunit CsdE [Salinivibrio sp. BNH]OOE34466.1 cysteine desulfurase, sulfur acceptor subunit CsdE [Salinivibrio kushneri]OOE39039.1 cysteine desulfurase, sulfur acceptor subunit CsdE [Salinivibrio kushneri]OOE44157.1 cysteine desulfurase, sulfur acceptor subunit CsdE [Salinivibrio kushneri]OOE47386.1 cysteine desulfurase, sulfur acceptor subunit CsdE [Salinivibrio ku